MFRYAACPLILLSILGSTTTPQDKNQGVNEIAGKVKEVDTKKKQFIITLGDKSERTFLVNKATKFTGPRGADHEEGLHDETMAKGSEIRVIPAADEKFAKEVKLSERKKSKDKSK